MRKARLWVKGDVEGAHQHAVARYRMEVEHARQATDDMAILLVTCKEYELFAWWSADRNVAPFKKRDLLFYAFIDEEAQVA